ncbi:MAG: hypothetical protein ACTMH4_12480 [Sphingobacterium sp.]
MGIRYEKDSIVDWANELGKFLRLIVDKYNAFDEPVAANILEDGYLNFFQKERDWMHGVSEQELFAYVNKDLQEGQIRPLGLLILDDAKFSNVSSELKKSLFRKAKLLLNHASERLEQFSFEDYERMTEIENELLK